jgi:hypothetical protein
MNDTFGIEITYFGRPFRAGLGLAAPPRAKALGLQFGHFEKARPGDFHDFSPSEFF